MVLLLCISWHIMMMYKIQQIYTNETQFLLQPPVPRDRVDLLLALIQWQNFRKIFNKYQYLRNFSYHLQGDIQSSSYICSFQENLYNHARSYPWQLHIRSNLKKGGITVSKPMALAVPKMLAFYKILINAPIFGALFIISKISKQTDQC